MEAAKAALRSTPLTIEQFKRINRMNLIDKLMPTSIASGLELELRDVEAALWKPAQAKSAYMAFQAYKSAEVRRTAPTPQTQGHRDHLSVRYPSPFAF